MKVQVIWYGPPLNDSERKKLACYHIWQEQVLGCQSISWLVRDRRGVGTQAEEDAARSIDEVENILRESGRITSAKLNGMSFTRRATVWARMAQREEELRRAADSALHCLNARSVPKHPRIVAAQDKLREALGIRRKKR